MGWYKEAVPYSHPNFGKLFRCGCGQTADRQRADAQTRAQLHTERGRYADATLDSFDWDRPFPAVVEWDQNVITDAQTNTQYPASYTPAQQATSFVRARRVLDQYVAQPSGGLFLQGPYGSGKTHLAAAIANVFTAQQQRAEYMTIEKMLRRLRTGFADHSTDARLEHLINLDFLALDDLGSEHLSGWGDAHLFAVVNERYNAARCTLLTSNVPIANVGGRIRSRVLEECEIVTLAAYDYRMLVARERLQRGAV